METTWREKVIKDCPLLFNEHSCTYFECGDGWSELITTLCHQLEALVKELPPGDFEYGVAVTQVKEKYGTLRFYMAGATEAMYNVIDQAEVNSVKICEQCGAPGSLRGTRWFYTACESCHAKCQKSH